MVPHFGSRDSLISHFNQKMSRGGGCSSWLAFIVPSFNFLSSHLLTGTRFFVLIIYKYTTDLLYVMSVRDLYCFYKIQTSTKFIKNCHKVPIYSGLRFIFAFAFTVLPLIFYEVLHLWFSSQISKAYGMTLMEHLMTRGTWLMHTFMEIVSIMTVLFAPMCLAWSIVLSVDWFGWRRLISFIFGLVIMAHVVLLLSCCIFFMDGSAC